MTLSTSLLERLARSPLGMQLADQERQERLARRQALAGQLGPLEAAHVKESAVLQAERERLRQVRDTAARALKDAERSLLLASAPVMAVASRYEHARGRIEA